MGLFGNPIVLYKVGKARRMGFVENTPFSFELTEYGKAELALYDDFVQKDKVEKKRTVFGKMEAAQNYQFDENLQYGSI